MNSFSQPVIAPQFSRPPAANNKLSQLVTVPQFNNSQPVIVPQFSRPPAASKLR